MRLADYIAQFLIDHSVTDVFSVIGGGAMHLNDALGHADGLHVTYNHHEQACAMAAEAYARVSGRIAAVCVTTGPGGLNALTGVAGGWLDSIPMFILSGQVRFDTTARYAARTAGAQVRSVGDQEYDIIRSVEPMTKWTTLVEDPKQIRKTMERAWHLATSGRPGPVWLDIPLDVQNAEIEPDLLEGYDPAEDGALLPPPVSAETVQCVWRKLQQAKRPVFYAGSGIRFSGGYEDFRAVIERLQMPIVTYWDAIDLIEDTHPLYIGRAGNMGDRPGNWAVQNADLVLAVGTRLSIRQVGYNWQTWARAAEVIMVDIDKEELKKPTLHVELPIWADARDFLAKLLAVAEREKKSKETASALRSWLALCQSWKENYPVVLPHHREENGQTANVYAFVDYLSSRLPEDSRSVVSNGACCVVGSQAYHIQKNSRFVNNNAIASMGYGLPAAIGVCIGEKKPTICLEGDGSLMMNLQELQTVIGRNLPIKLFVINNEGYHSLRITQENIFPEHSKVGIGPESGDLSFPRYQKIAEAFGFPYLSAHSNAAMQEVVDAALQTEGPVFVEIFTGTEQVWEPKSSARRRPDGTLESPPLEDLAPFLPREELREIMQIPLLSEENAGDSAYEKDASVAASNQSISLLDCTLRDGGYINDWSFGEDAIRGILKKIARTGVEFLEIGFLKGDTYDPDRAMFPDIASAASILAPKQKGLCYLAMLDMSAPIPLDRIPPCDATTIDGIRIIFKKDRMEEAFAYAQAIRERGYLLSVNFVGTDQYTDAELAGGIEKFNALSPDIVAIVDSFGLMKRKAFLRCVEVAHRHLLPACRLGYHAHNNLQQAFGNAEALVEMELERDLVIDACVFGMGRGAGNLPLELFATYLNENYGAEYQVEPMLEIMDEYLQEIYKTKFWGYSLPLYVSATEGCHPNYAIYLAEKETLTVKAFRELLQEIPPEDKVRFSREKAEQYYRRYQENFVDDTKAREALAAALAEKDILVLAPGASLTTSREQLQKTITPDTVVIAANFMAEEFAPQFLFSSNMRRFVKMQGQTAARCLITSNMKEATQRDYVFNFASYASRHGEILDNSVLMLLRILQAAGAKKVRIAGMDGYTISRQPAYCSDRLEHDFSKEATVRNALIAEELTAIGRHLELVFETPTLYRIEGEKQK